MVASLAPWIGGPVGSILSGISADRKMVRINTCLEALARRIEQVHDTAAEEFVKTDDFADLLEETLRRVAMERSEEKRKIYGDFLVNNIGRPDFLYERRLRALRLLEEAQTSHIIVLKAMAQSPTQSEMSAGFGALEQTLCRRVPELAGEIPRLAKEMERLGLAENVVAAMGTMTTARDAANLARRISSVGWDLLAFIVEGDGTDGGWDCSRSCAATDVQTSVVNNGDGVLGR